MENRYELNKNLAQMLKGGVIMDVTTPEQAKIAEAAGACAVMALERIPADIRAAGGVARMSDPKMIKGIQAAVSIPVMAKCRIGHFAEAQILEAIEEVIDLVKASGIRAEISHLKTSGERNWHKIDAVLGRIERAVADGLLLGSDRYPFCAAGTDLDIVLPDWAQEGAAPAEMARLADPEARSRIVAELDASPRDWSQVMIGGAWHPKTKALCGKTVAEILSTNHETPGELVCRILELDRCRTGAFFFGMSEANLDKILSRDWIVPGSDASLRAPWGPLGADHPHPRAYGTMPEFYRRLRALGVTREAAVARMTSVPARRFGIRGRGTIERGAFADIAVWSESEFRSPATYTEPHRFAEGMRHVLVNGAVATLGAAGRRNAGRFLER